MRDIGVYKIFISDDSKCAYDFYNKFGLSKIDKDTRWSFNSETNTAMFKF